MNVLYCCDYEGWFGLEASLYSLLTHTKNVNIYIFTMFYERDEVEGHKVYEPIEGWQRYKTEQIVKYLDPQGSSVCFYDTAEEYQKYFIDGVDEYDGHSSPYAPLRLIVDVMLPNVKHILYLDCDTIIQEDLTPMYYYYLEKIGKSKDCAYAAYTNRLTDGSGEMVAGILVFDMIKAKELGLFERVRYNITHNHYKWYDQTALESSGKYIEMDATYNYMQPYDLRIYEPAILHFADGLSPKIYHDKVLFYKRYPHLEYIKKGCQLIDDANIVVKPKKDNEPIKGGKKFSC